MNPAAFACRSYERDYDANRHFERAKLCVNVQITNDKAIVVFSSVLKLYRFNFREHLV
jgi:hypothetical protein